MKLAQFTLIICQLSLLWACKHEDENQYKKIVELRATFDSLRTVNYEEALEIGQNLLDSSRAFAVEFSESKYAPLVKENAEQIFGTRRNLAQEYIEYKQLRENVLNSNNNSEVVDSLLRQVNSFARTYPQNPVANELSDMGNLLTFQYTIVPLLTRQFSNLADLNASIEKSNQYLDKIQDSLYRQPATDALQILLQQRGPLCDKETETTIKQVKIDMEKYAVDELQKDSWTANIGASLLGKKFTPDIKNEQVHEKDNVVVIDRDYVYLLRFLFAKKQYTIPVKGVIQKNCEAGISANITNEKAEVLSIN